MTRRLVLAAAAAVLVGDCSIPTASAFTPLTEPQVEVRIEEDGLPPSRDLGDDLRTDVTALPPAGPQVVSHLAPSEPPAHRYARMNRFECEAELTRRHASFARVEEARGVLAPVRLTGPLAGVSFHANLGEKDRATSPYEIYDCRLVLALEDFAHVLSREHIREVIHFSAYRPAVANAKRAIGFMGERHEGGLAVDIGALVRDDGTIVSIERDFHGGIGTSTCPNKVANKKSTAFWLRDLVCHEYDQGEFHVMLTPNYNWAHRNHFHFEVTSKAKWFYLR